MEGQQHRAEKREGKNSATDAGNESVATTAADLHCNHRILSRRHALIRDCHHRRLQCVQCAQDTHSVCMVIPRHAWSRYTIRKIRGENTVEVVLKTSGGEASEIESVARRVQASERWTYERLFAVRLGVQDIIPLLVWAYYGLFPDNP